MATTAQPLHVRAVPAGVAALAAYELAFGLWMLLAPRSFYDAVGPFGPYNRHYVLDTSTGRLLKRIHVDSGPHGTCVWPQPGRYSLGHTGNTR